MCVRVCTFTRLRVSVYVTLSQCWKGVVCWLFVVDSWEGLTQSCFPSSRLQPSYFRHQGRLRYLDFFLSCMILIHLSCLFFITRSVFLSTNTLHIRVLTILFSTKSFSLKASPLPSGYPSTVNPEQVIIFTFTSDCLYFLCCIFYLNIFELMQKNDHSFSFSCLLL